MMAHTFLTSKELSFIKYIMFSKF